MRSKSYAPRAQGIVLQTVLCQNKALYHSDYKALVHSWHKQKLIWLRINLIKALNEWQLYAAAVVGDKKDGAKCISVDFRAEDSGLIKERE